MAQPAKITIRPSSVADIPTVRELFLEYASSLGFSLCFQNFDRELASLPGEYVPPHGRLLLAEADGPDAGKIAGCVALHRLEDGVCEMKRLYVRPGCRGSGAGRALAEAVIREAQLAGYRRMRLDSVVGVMDEAIALYRRLGFRDIPSYRPNPVPGAIYLELELDSRQ